MIHIAKIGESFNSETTLPSRCKVDDLVLWDCPGFEDNRGADQDIINAFYITHITKQSKDIRLCSLLHYDLTKGKSNGLSDFGEQIDRLFLRKSEIYKDSLAIVVTNVPKKGKIDNIKSRLTKMIGESKGVFKNGDALKNSIQNLSFLATDSWGNGIAR